MNHLIIKSDTGRKPVTSQVGTGLVNSRSQAGAGIPHIRGTNSRQPPVYISKPVSKVR